MIQQTKHYKEFTKTIESIAYSHSSMSEVFDDFLTMTLSALSFGRAEQLYKDTVARYKTQDQPKFGVALGALFQAYEENVTADGGWCDVLGSFFEEHNGKFGRDAKGQFFTPETVCDFMAQITAIDAEADGDTPRTLMEPSCGSGRNLMAFDRLHPRNRFKMFYTACDIDSRCVKMCALNMFMHGMKGVVIHMDTLRLEVWGGYRVYLTETGLGIQPLTKHQAMSFLTRPSEPEQVQETAPTQADIPTEVVAAIQSDQASILGKNGQVHLF